VSAQTAVVLAKLDASDYKQCVDATVVGLMGDGWVSTQRDTIGAVDSLAASALGPAPTRSASQVAVAAAAVEGQGQGEQVERGEAGDEQLKLPPPDVAPPAVRGLRRLEHGLREMLPSPCGEGGAEDTEATNALIRGLDATLGLVAESRARLASLAAECERAGQPHLAYYLH
jgi:hypothetical protein